MVLLGVDAFLLWPCKADSLFKYARDPDLASFAVVAKQVCFSRSDKDMLRQCWKLGLAQEEAGLANLTVPGALQLAT
eukprot:6232000-Amphidinium_carterae.1